jgi:hypothetical protein
MEKQIWVLVDAGLNAAIDTNRTAATAVIDKRLIFIYQITLNIPHSTASISKRYGLLNKAPIDNPPSHPPPEAYRVINY